MNIDNVLAQAQRLMLDENWNRQVEMGAAAQRAGSINGSNNGGSNDLAALEAMAFGSSPAVNETNYYTPIPENAKMAAGNSMIRNDGIEILRETRTPKTAQNSKLPKSILESFAKQPPLSGDDISVPISYYQSQPQVINEQSVVKQTTTVPQQMPAYSSPAPSPQIDYQYIKHLIDESIKEHMKCQINESANLNNFKAMRLGEGNVIQFIDSRGNLYEGVLKLKKKSK